MSSRTMRMFMVAAGLCLFATHLATAQQDTAPQTGYADVNGLHMYYEIHGTNTGTPLVVLHGAYMSIDTMGAILPRLAETRQVIAVELQGHGRTNDVADRPLSYEQMADDVAALMQSIGVQNADVFGYSMGGSTALQLAIRHPEKVRKLVVISATYTSEGWHSDLHEMIKTITPEMFAGSPMETDYLRLAPNPANWATLVNKLVALDLEVQNWSDEAMQSIAAPALLIIGDSDAVQPEHTVEMFRLFGGGVNGDLVGLPHSQLAIIPGATHISVMMRVELLNTLITEFLNAPMPA
jgi:pimeloyl-ACP methyl ester carboxylesterase